MEKDPAVVQSLEARYGPMFRALGGSAPAKPATPAPKSLGNGPNILQAAQRDAYVAFKAKFPNQPKETIDSAWKESLAAYFQGQPSGSLGAMHFKQFAADGFVRPEAQSPIEENAAFDPEEIPF